MRIKIILVGVIHFISQSKFLNAKLIDTCNLPWKDYRIQGTHSRITEINKCHEKCAGHAFYKNESELICFKEKSHAIPVPLKLIEDRKFELCYCGYYKTTKTVVGPKGKARWKSVPDWQKCDPIKRTEYINDKAKRGCKVECSGLAVYIHNWGSKRYLLHCEEEKRTDFYNVVGLTGNLKEYHSNDRSLNVPMYRICTCGIENKAIVKLNKTTFSTSTDMVKEFFNECPAPWNVPKVPMKKFESCFEFCNKRCSRGKGIHHRGTPVCFHNEKESKMKAVRSKMAEEGCECGYVKQKDYRHKVAPAFLSCNPKITSNTRNRTECINFCAESRVYITLFFDKPMNIHCIYKSDVEKLKPKHLIGKCEENSDENEENSQRRYTCRCGLGRSLKINNTVNNFHFANESKNENTALEIPPSWTVRKKRSVVTRDKTSFNPIK